MAYYTSLISLIELLKDISLKDKCEIHSSLFAKLRHLQNSLEDYSAKDKAMPGSLERQIRDAAYKAQDIIETKISNPGPVKYHGEDLQRLKTDVGSLMEELMRIKESYKSHEDHGASTLAVPEAGTSMVRSRIQCCADKVSRTIHILQSKSPVDSHPDTILDKEDIASLVSKLSHFQELLRDYSPNDIDRGTADSLERRIEFTTFEVEYFIMNNISTSLGTEYCASLEKVQKKVTSIVECLTTDQDNLKVNHYSANSAGASTQAPNIDSTGGASVSGKNTTVGLDESLMTTIKGQLCGEPSKFQVVSIVGMGGIGKTTWARNIFDDKLICVRFDCRAWVTVSQDYHLPKILRAILSSLNILNIEELPGAGEEVLKEAGEAVLKERICRRLYGRRYLIIMDDMWDTKFWDKIKRIFPDQSNGSRVMITTRQSDVAFYASTSDFIHHIPLLNKLQSWNLFYERVSCPTQLEEIGRSIARKCRGLPLAIVVIAGLLSKVNRTRYDWEKIARGISSIAAQNDEHFSKILSLSYNFLPHHLKPCFLHLGVFPANCQIHASQLIKIWVAEGFVQPTESNLEDVAEGYLEDLVSRSLVLISKKKSSGKIKYCSIHDLLRDLCLQRSSYENFLHVINNDLVYSEDIRNVRRLHISHPDSFRHLCRVKEYARNVRSIYSFADVGDHFLSVAYEFKLMRVLNAVDTRSYASPTEIAELLHLRYLGLSYLPVPPSISKLQNLQTLVLEGDQTILPSEIWNMPNLRHVIIRQMTLPPIPQGEMIVVGVPLLGKLQTLSTVVDFIFTSDTVEMIPSLKKLKVFYSEAFKSWDAFGLDNLVRLSQLETLHIEFSLGESNMSIPVEPLPQNFAFSENLERLSLSGCRLPWGDMMVVASLPNLQSLKLRLDAFVGEEWETIEGQFPKLKFLLMEKLLYLKDWRAENTHFPCLEHLIIRDCGRLQEIPSEIGDSSTLQLIEAYGSKLAKDSALRIQKEQSDHGNDVQVRV